ncbi:MAG TPA: hypothetical protein VMY43_08590 [Methanothrix sp.]|nr:hypothetical protein [Methanothrix sp.]
MIKVQNRRMEAIITIPVSSITLSRSLEEVDIAGRMSIPIKNNK